LDANDVEGTSAHVSDQSILNRQSGAAWIQKEPLVKEVGEVGWQGSPLVHFPNGAVYKYRPGTAKSTLMLEFLRI
jgi:hypothetical protein